MPMANSVAKASSEKIRSIFYCQDFLTVSERVLKIASNLILANWNDKKYKKRRTFEVRSVIIFKSDLL